eukprot:c20719_g1_i2 orf=668-931(-)
MVENGATSQQRDCSLTDSWIFSIAGAILAIPYGIKRKSLGPLVFFGSTGAMLDIIMSVMNCEREFQQRQQRQMMEQETTSVANEEAD